MPSIALIGDYQASVTAHQAIPLGLKLAGERLGIATRFEWIPTDEIDGTARLAKFDGVWCVPASPYRSTAGALTAIRFARETQLPYLGTCGGFQHDKGEVRALELRGHPFFIATLFQPERAALRGECPPPAAAFVRACVGCTTNL
jgi:CTP synthase (UTP-ammonia lyase)